MSEVEDDANKPKKYFTVVDAIVMTPECKYSDLFFGGKSEVGRYVARSPYQAAKKASTKLLSSFKNNNIDCEFFYFAIREQTRNAPRVIRLYSGTRIKLDTPHIWQKKKKNDNDEIVSIENNIQEYRTKIRAILEPEQVQQVIDILNNKGSIDNTESVETSM
ncbi:hypothetical protein TetV_157 [Tetraselmis virus 1]|uniref:Uncharacterized protein n=1 Tax=Tetraselmis virus 1 TaxID=2060617 RepID=A0A2P0VNC0_9VIRU|nr:hypothetical protein QJ968_gp157 [Tetraselmis virus 1]AUF82249.1 hypothetical protein TetV_157 [Tetraselmis virus 1]